MQLVFQPSWLTQTYSPPVIQALVFCPSGTSGVTNRIDGSHPGSSAPIVVSCASQPGLTSLLNAWPPLVDEYIVPSVYSPTIRLALPGSTITSKPSPPAGSTICGWPEASSEVPLSWRPPHTPRPLWRRRPARAS